MLLKWGADYAEGGGGNTLGVTCPQGGGGEGGKYTRGKYAVTPGILAQWPEIKPF